MRQHNFARPLNVVVIGGTRGLGRSFVKQFFNAGHNVVFTGRKQDGIIDALDEHVRRTNKVVGVKSDISNVGDLEKLGFSIENNFDNVVDIWINNAARADGNTPFLETNTTRMKEIIDTNLFGTMAATQKAIDISSKASLPVVHRMHIFNVSGAGSDGSPSPEYAVYGATKAGIMQFTRTMQREFSGDRGIGLHILSPGLMPTDLISENVCSEKRVIYNILCEEPDVVAETLVPEMLSVVAQDKSAETLRYLTVSRILYHLLTAHLRKDRYFG